MKLEKLLKVVCPDVLYLKTTKYKALLIHTLYLCTFSVAEYPDVYINVWFKVVNNRYLGGYVYLISLVWFLNSDVAPSWISFV